MDTASIGQGIIGQGNGTRMASVGHEGGMAHVWHPLDMRTAHAWHPLDVAMAHTWHPLAWTPMA